MQKRLFVLSFVVCTLFYNGVEHAVTAHPEPSRHILSGDELQRLLIGNTLKGYDGNGSFWIYYPDHSTIWGKASDGDVDIGTWWVKDERYCRTWRRWFDGRTQCWTLATQGQGQIIWFGDHEQLIGASTLEYGNSINTQLAAQQESPESTAKPASDLSEVLAPEHTAAVVYTPHVTMLAPVAATVHLRIGAGLRAAERERIETALSAAGYGTVVVHEMPFTISRSRVGYFQEADRAFAEALITALHGSQDLIELRDYSKLVALPEPGRLDLWIKS